MPDPVPSFECEEKVENEPVVCSRGELSRDAAIEKLAALMEHSDGVQHTDAELGTLAYHDSVDSVGGFVVDDDGEIEALVESSSDFGLGALTVE